MPVGANFDPYFFKNSFVETLKVVSSNPATHQRHIAILSRSEFSRIFANFRELFVARDHWPEPLTPALVIKNDVRQQSITPSNYYYYYYNFLRSIGSYANSRRGFVI